MKLIHRWPCNLTNELCSCGCGYFIVENCDNNCGVYNKDINDDPTHNCKFWKKVQDYKLTHK